MNTRETVYNEHTPAAVRSILEGALQRKTRIRLFYGDTEHPDFERIHGRKPNPGQSWNDENDVCGYVGRSAGEKPIPLLIANSRSMGGGGILDGSIVRILEEGREVYRHPGYRTPAIIIEDERMTRPDGPKVANLPIVAFVDGKEHARFKTEKQAIRWAAFMRGERMAK